MTVHYILYAIAAFIGALLIFMIIRTLCIHKPKYTYSVVKDEIDVNLVAETLSNAIRIPTVTKYKESDDQSSFIVFHDFLKNTFTEIFKRAEVTVINNYSLIIRVDGTDQSLTPGCFLAHMDVVPANKDDWEYDPFGGEVHDGYIYGRGSLDMKNQLVTSMYGLEFLLREGKVPKRTIYYCFGHDEENTGVTGALKIVEYLKEKNVRFDFVLDEGGVIMNGNIVKADGTFALIGTCEKGYVDFQLTSEREGGHASSPKRKSSVDALADAIHDLRRTPMKMTWSQPLKEFFRTVCPYMTPVYKFLFANRDILSPVLKLALSLSAPIMNSVLRTTFAFTQIKGSDAPNVIPVKSTAIVNTRINIGETQQQVKDHIQNVVGKDIKVDYYSRGFDPTPISKTIGSEIYSTLESSIRDVFEFIPAPYPFIAATDAKHYYPLSDNVYRFTPFNITLKEQPRIHGLNERCKIESLEKATLFYKVFITRTCL